jgi:hypothetical protein
MFTSNGILTSLAHATRPFVTLVRLAVLLPAMAAAAFLLHRERGSSRAGDTTPIEPAWTASDALWRAAHPDVELSVVMPFYNPGSAMRPTVDRLVTALREEQIGFEVICVSDGSTDGSELTLDGAGDEVRVIVNPVNRGKGAALHTGFSHALGRYVGMVDCDGDIDPLHLLDYVKRAQRHGAHVVYADKRAVESTSASSLMRKTVSMGFSTVVGALFALGVRDTQTGCKLFSRHALATVLPRLREERFAFDLEFFVAAKAAGITGMMPAPVHLSERLAGSTVTSTAILRTLGDALTVLGRLHLTPTYRTAAQPVAVVAPLGFPTQRAGAPLPVAEVALAA